MNSIVYVGQTGGAHLFVEDLKSVTHIMCVQNVYNLIVWAQWLNSDYCEPPQTYTLEIKLYKEGLGIHSICVWIL